MGKPQKQKQNPGPLHRTMRLSIEDEKIVAALIRKKGGSFPSVTREAWRLLAAKEELSFATR